MNKGVYINDDFGDFYFATVPESAMNEERLKKQIDFYTEKGGVKAILFNLNASRAYFDSRTRDPIWKGLEERDGRCFFRGQELHSSFANAAKNCRALFRNVPDPMRFRYDYCHRCGTEMWISMRMNDIHWIDRDVIMHDDIHRNHPEFRRAAHRNNPSWWPNLNLDYTHPEVFEWNIALMEEYFERFEMDGFELDWLRTQPHVRPGTPDAGRSLITGFMRRTRAAADKAAARRGHPVKIAVRLPLTPETAYASGFDAAAWADEGLIDVAVPSPYFISSCHDLPVEIWKRYLGKKVEIAPCLELHVTSGHSNMVLTDIDADCGFAAAYLAQGADALYLFNHFPGNGYISQPLDENGGVWNMKEFPLPPLPYAEGRETQKEFFGIAGDIDATGRHVRRHILTCREEYFYETGHKHLTCFSAEEKCVAVPFDLGLHTEKRRGQIVLGFPQGKKPESLQVYCNATPCAETENGVFPWSRPNFGTDSEELELFFYQTPPDVLHDRTNVCEVFADVPMNIFWLELDIMNRTETITKPETFKQEEKND